MIGEARVVCLGESAHAVSEFYLLKDRLFRYLATELGFTAFVMESGFAEGLAVNEWIHGGAGEIGHLSRSGVTYEFGDSDLFRTQLAWMRERALAGRPLNFYGMDLPGASVDPGAAVTVCLSRLPPRAGDSDLAALAQLGDRYAAPLRWASLTEEDQNTLATGIGALTERADAADDDVSRLCAAGARLVVNALDGGGTLGPDHNPRDELMARTVEWLLEREQRIVISAHNGHVQRFPLFGAPSLGTLLAPALGDDLVVIGTTRASGSIAELHADVDPLVPSSASEDPVPWPSAHTLDALLDTAGPQHLTRLDLVPAAAKDAVTVIGMQTMELDIDPAAFDAIAHIREIHPLPGTVQQMQRSIDAATGSASRF